MICILWTSYHRWEIFYNGILSLLAIKRNKAITYDRQRITLYSICRSCMWSGMDYIWNIAWLALTASRCRYRLYCQSLKWIPFFSYSILFSMVVRKWMLLSFILYPKAMRRMRKKKVIIIKITSIHHHTSVQCRSLFFPMNN